MHIYIQVELIQNNGSRMPVINYTEIQFDLSSCSMQVTPTTEHEGSVGSMITTNGEQIICHMTNYVNHL